MDFSWTTIPITSETDVVTARTLGGRLASQAGLDVIQAHCVMISVSELASNILQHADSGEIAVRIIFHPDGGQGIEVVARDRGNGIEDLRLAMQDGFSTRGSLGCGLPGVKRLMSEIEIGSEVGVGTVVRALKWARDTPGLKRLAN